MRSTQALRRSAPTAALAMAIVVWTTMASSGAFAAPAKAHRAAIAEGEILLLHLAEGHVIETPTGTRHRLDLPAKAQASSFVTQGESWYAAAFGATLNDGQPGLRVLSGHGDKARTLPSPPTGAARLVIDPVLLTGPRGLGAIVWLEGEDSRLEVRAARWLGDRWSEAEILAPPGPGSQIAITAATLDDGTWLVAWAAYDGQDDEIMFSRHKNDSGWSAPQRIGGGNTVPDITPALVALAGGRAMITWARYDGRQYRVNLSAFNGHEWSPAVAVGDQGTAFPAWDSAGEEPLLLYQRGEPYGWTVAEVLTGDAGPALGRQAHVLTRNQGVPLVERRASSLTLRWPTRGERLQTELPAAAPVR